MAVQYAFGKIITQGLDLNVDAADPTSYPGSGTSWTNVVNRSITGSLISCSFSSDFKGGIVFNNPSASVVFPGTVANYGTGSFTVEMAFRPTQINGIHYLVSKNSGSFPNWGVYLSGSGGSGKLFAEYRISSTVSCSISSSTTFVTGSNYFVDVIYSIPEGRNYIVIDGGYDAISTVANGSGSLTNTGSLFVGNLIASSSQSYSGSIFNTKVYSTINVGYTNFRSISPRLQKVSLGRPSNALALIVGGGGGGGGLSGGGAGGVLFTFTPLPSGVTTINVGAGGAGSNSTGANGQNSSFGAITAIGGGGGGSVSTTGSSGGSGGGGSLSGSGVPGQGFDGGKSFDAGTGAGGGGASQKGISPTVNQGLGPGGSGSYFDLFTGTGYGTPVGWFGGGGTGVNGFASGRGGFGGGGGVAGTGSANTGGGGGAAYYGTGGRGGSGIVAIRYPGPPIATGGTITQAGGDTIHTFTATGSHTFTVL